MSRSVVPAPPGRTSPASNPRCQPYPSHPSLNVTPSPKTKGGIPMRNIITRSCIAMLILLILVVVHRSGSRSASRSSRLSSRAGSSRTLRCRTSWSGRSTALCTYRLTRRSRPSPTSPRRTASPPGMR